MGAIVRDGGEPILRVRLRTLLVICVCVAVTTCETVESHVDAYIKGMQAIRAHDWSQAIEELSKAIAVNNKETASGSIHVTGEGDIPYIPYYYRGLAWRALGNCIQAARDLAVSRHQHEKNDESRRITRYVRDYSADVSGLGNCDMQLAVERYFRNSVLHICSLYATSSACVNKATGFLIGKGGLVLTCNHVLKNCHNTSCIEESHRSDCLPATGGTASLGSTRGPRIRFHVVARDCDADLAILQLENIPAESLGTSICDVAPPLAVASQGKVFALGFPVGQDGLRLMSGIITGDLTQNGHLPTDVPLTWGMSGCPVFNQEGYVVAVGVGGDLYSEHANEVIPLGRASFLLRRAGVGCPW